MIYLKFIPVILYLVEAFAKAQSFVPPLDGSDYSYIDSGYTDYYENGGFEESNLDGPSGRDSKIDDYSYGGTDSDYYENGGFGESNLDGPSGSDSGGGRWPQEQDRFNGRPQEQTGFSFRPQRPGKEALVVDLNKCKEDFVADLNKTKEDFMAVLNKG